MSVGQRVAAALRLQQRAQRGSTQAFGRVPRQGPHVSTRSPDRGGRGRLSTSAAAGEGFYFDDPDREPDGADRGARNAGLDGELRELATNWAAAEADGDVGDPRRAPRRGVLRRRPVGLRAGQGCVAAPIRRWAAQPRPSRSLSCRSASTEAARSSWACSTDNATFNGVRQQRPVSDQLRGDPIRGVGWKIASCHIGPVDPRAVQP